MPLTIGLLLDSLATDYHKSIQDAAERLTRERGLHLLTVLGRRLAAPNVSEAAQNFVYKIVGNARVDGLLIASSIGNFLTPDDFGRYCEHFQGVPSAAVGVALPGVPSVVSDNRGGLRAIVEHLFTAHGCRRLAYIGGPEPSQEARDRLDGFVDAHRAAGLEIDRALITHGDFMPASGCVGMEAILARGERPDAVVAANDLMALGALDVLRARGLRVPEDVVVTGFDDAPAAKFASPSLTTVRQPFAEELGAALSLVLRQIRGEPVPRITRMSLDLVMRQSCGCAFHVESSEPPAAPPPLSLVPVSSRIAERRPTLIAALRRAVRLPDAAWAARFVDAFLAELGGDEGNFLSVLQRLLDEGSHHAYIFDELFAAIRVLRAEVRRSIGAVAAIEDMWHAAVALVGTAEVRREVRGRSELQLVAEQVSHGLERISTALDHEALCDAVRHFLPRAGITDAAIALFPDLQQGPDLAHVLAIRNGERVQLASTSFPASELAPRAMFAGEERASYVVLPLTFAERQLGIATFSSGVLWHIYLMLRDQVGGALMSASLHRAVVRETQARERAEREQTERELRIAQAIQTVLVPIAPVVAGYEVSGRLVPAVDVGGDYFDVLAAEGVCWIGIGDVTGHGLMAGVIMMMMRSMVAALLEGAARATPSSIVRRMNGALFDTVRHRLRRDDYATLCLLRLDPDGHVTYAGAHEDLVVYRARTRRCESFTTNGVWVGVIPDISALTPDEGLVLEPDDVLVLHTDGLTEAMSSRKERFGLERVIAMLECRHGAPVDEIRDALIDGAVSYGPLQRDDITVAVIRYRPIATT